MVSTGTGSAVSDALLADMLQDSDLRVCDNPRLNLASTIPKKKVRGLHSQECSDADAGGDGGEDGNNDGTGHLVVCVHGLAGNQYVQISTADSSLRFEQLL